MIPKVDSYFSKALKHYVDMVLSSIGTKNERYIINEALGDMEEGVLDSFKQSFGGSDGSKKHIDVTYAFPKQKEQVDARYVIYRGKLEESHDSIGMVQGVAAEARPANGENIQTDFTVVNKDNLGYFVELSKPIYDLISINEVASEQEYVAWEVKDDDPNRLNLTPLIAEFFGKPISVTYNVMDDGDRKDYGGVNVGFNATDSIVVQSVSNNEDTVRCLDSLLKYILIIMRSTQQEGNFYQLAHMTSEGLQIGDETLDNPVFVIPTVVTYEVTYSVRNDSLSAIKRIMLNGKDTSNG